MAAVLTSLQSHLADRYRIERELGRGGMGTVYLAADLKHHRRVAIKVLEPEMAAVLGRERFLREIETAARLTHPHILPLHDSGEAGGTLFYVMPYVEGESLQARLAREKQLPVADALRIAREVADALAFAHAHGVVHRDIKPGNILLEGDHAVVADFGLARAIAGGPADAEAPTGAGGLTVAGAAVGTPAYMSPEQAVGANDVDGRSDQYALGCVLYELLAGRPPFAGGSAESLVHRHLTEAPRPVTELRPEVPDAVRDALARALAKTREERFATTAEFAKALEGDAQGANRGWRLNVVPRVPPWLWRIALPTAVAVAVTAALLFQARPVGRTTTPPSAPDTLRRSSIAVLPFQNLSEAGPNAFFAGGLHDELLTQLTKVGALRVISRTSVMGYQGSSKPLRQIAEELGVGAVVEGTVQVVGGRLRVSVQLIDALTDEHLWAERYDRTLDDVFAIQSEVAERIVAGVGATLPAADRERLTIAPTRIAEAYRLYLLGRQHHLTPGYHREDREAAQRCFERALALDPAFALAHAALSRVHGEVHWLGFERTPERVAKQIEEAEIALRLAPGLPEAHLAMGVAYYWGRLDYRRALREFEKAAASLPNDAEIVALVGYVNRRLGDWEQVSTAYERAARLNPRDANLHEDLGAESFYTTHRYADAVRAFDRALAIAPDQLHLAAVSRAQTFVAWRGEMDTLRMLLDRVTDDTSLGEAGPVAQRRAWRWLLERNADSLLAVAQRAPVPVFEGQIFFLPVSLYAAWACVLKQDAAASRAEFRRALALCDSALAIRSDDRRVHAARGLALAGLGRREDAHRESRWLRQSVIYRKDARQRPMVEEDSAMILAQAGDTTAVFDDLERLLAGPSQLSTHLLRLDPRWDPIRGHPRFQALLAKYPPS